MQETVTITRDDIDNSEAAESVSFGLDGKWYLIDLSADHCAALRDQLAYWQKFARRDRSRGRGAASRPVNGAQTPASEVRAWALANDIPVNKRGKVPAELVERYLASRES